MGRNRQREFWLEPNSPAGLSEAILREISDLTRPDAIILSTAIPSLPVRVATRTRGGDILLTDNPEEVKIQRDLGIPVALEVEIHNKTDHQRVLDALRMEPDYLIVDCPDWKIIPLENIIAEHDRNDGTVKPRLLAKTRTFEESRVALGVLDLGADGIALCSDNVEEAKKTRELIGCAAESQVNLSTAKVQSVKPIQAGARVCVDTTELIQPDEGLLVGCSSQALFLVEAEVHANPHISPRPFRINAGPVSLYVLTSNAKTRYLSDLEAGETVLVVGKNGRSRSVDVARVKVERRPMVLVEATTGARSVKTILQNAETVRLLGPEGSIPIHELKPGDEVYIRLENGGRHFGSLVEHEMIIEK